MNVRRLAVIAGVLFVAFARPVHSADPPLAWAGLEGNDLRLWLPMQQLKSDAEEKYPEGTEILFNNEKKESARHSSKYMGQFCESPPELALERHPVASDDRDGVRVSFKCPLPEISPETLHGQGGVMRRTSRHGLAEEGDDTPPTLWEVTLSGGKSVFVWGNPWFIKPQFAIKLPKDFLLGARRRLVGVGLTYNSNGMQAARSFRRLSPWAIEPEESKKEIAHLEQFVVRDVVMGPKKRTTSSTDCRGTGSGDFI